MMVAEDGSRTVVIAAIRKARHLSDALEERCESFEVFCRHCRNVALNEAAAQRQAKDHGVDCSRRWEELTRRWRQAHTGVGDSS